MMILKFIYGTFLIPPGIFIIALIFLCFYSRRFNKKLSNTMICFTLILYFSSTPLVGRILIHTLERNYIPPQKPQGDVIIMLGGGATLDTPNINTAGHLSGSAANRLITAAELQKMLNVPIIVSGGQVYKNTGTEAMIAEKILTALGVPENKIITESKSLNTTQNAEFTKKLLVKNNFKKPLLVTSAFHMKRAVLQFKRYSQEVTPFPTDYQSNVKQVIQIADLVPSADAMLEVSSTLKEYLGILYSKCY